jgi:hypothetical protein
MEKEKANASWCLSYTKASCSNSAIFSLVIFSFQFSFGSKNWSHGLAILQALLSSCPALVTVNVSGSSSRKQMRNVIMTAMKLLLSLRRGLESSLWIDLKMFYSQ